MKELEEIKSIIFQLSKERCCNPAPFEEFTARLSEVGVIRQTYDVIKDEVSFYSKDSLLSTLAMLEINGSPNIDSFPIGDVLDAGAIKQAIMDFDSGIISSPIEFHRRIALAGIVYVTVHLMPRKIYYLSQDAQFYLESY
jgi:uncharacterized protein YbcV (DUF1398 family)